jgi:DNA replication protein DnaC
MDFEEFWREYPRKVGRMKAERTWKRMSDNERYMAIRGLRLWCQTVQWQSNGGLFVPYASTFLNQERWREEPWTGAFGENGIAF